MGAFGGQRQLEHGGARGAHARDVRLEHRLCVAVDDGADVGRKERAVADAQLVHRALQHLHHAVGDVVLQAQHAQRRAALARAVERGRQRIRDDLFGQRGAVDDHRVLAAGLGNQQGVVGALRQRPVDELRHRSGTGEEDAGDARIGDQRRADGLAVAGEQLQRGTRHAGAMEQLHGHGGDQRRLFGGLGQHRVAGRERRADLSDKDGEREIPRRDACDGAERLGRAQRAPRLQRVVAAEIGGLAHFAYGVGERLPGFARGQRDQRGTFAFDEVGCAFQARGALGRGNAGPCGARGDGKSHRMRDVCGRGVDDGADDVAAVARIGDRHGRRAK